MLLTVTSTKQLTEDIWELNMGGSFPYAQAQAGQFVNIRVGTGHDHLLRRPISIAHLDRKASLVTIVFRVVGQGTWWLSQRKPGDELDLLGPLGVGFPLPPAAAKVLIVGGGVGSPPLYQLAQDVAGCGAKIDIVLGFSHARQCFWLDKFAAMGNLILATEDGSLGTLGYVTHALALLEGSWDYVYGCGPLPMLKAVKEFFSGQKVKGYVSLEERMACGVGACHGCVCRAKDGTKNLRVCHDGPVFSWEAVEL